MAQKQARKLRPEDIGTLQPEQLDELQKFLKTVRENWKQIAGGVALVAVCLLAYFAFQAKRNSDELTANSLYAKAFMQTKDDDKKVALLEEAAAKGSDLQLEILYVLGEESLRSGKHDKAKEAMSRIVSEHPDSEYAPRAADALAFLKVNDKDIEEAIQDYENVKAKWPNSFEALRVPNKIAALQEQLGNVEAAVTLYKEQLTLFPESGSAEEAQAALDRLKIHHPQFFPEDEELKELAALEAPVEKPTPEETTETPAEVTPAPAEETPMPAETTEAPAEETPAPAETTEAPAEATEAPAEAIPAPTEETPAPAEETPAPAEAIETPAAQ